MEEMTRANRLAAACAMRSRESGDEREALVFAAAHRTRQLTAHDGDGKNRGGA
jgi:hypothetical protein